LLEITKQQLIQCLDFLNTLSPRHVLNSDTDQRFVRDHKIFNLPPRFAEGQEKLLVVVP
jgi:hypothetical protein